MPIVLVAARIRAGNGDEADIHQEASGDLDIGVGLEHVTRRQRNAIAWLDLDGTFNAPDPAPGFLVRAVSGPIDLLFVLEGRVQQRISATEAYTAPNPAVDLQLEPLPKGLAKVFEIAETRLFGRDEEDIVAIAGAKPAGVPTQV